MSMLSRIIWLFFLALVGFFTGFISLQVWRAANSPKWPTSEGVVVAFYETPNYRYSVNNRIYTNDVASCNELFSRFWAIRNSTKYAVRYPLDAKVLVHYCPGKPEVAVLETKFDSAGLIIVGGLLLVTGVCAAGVVFGPAIGGRRSGLSI